LEANSVADSVLPIGTGTLPIEGEEVAYAGYALGFSRAGTSQAGRGAFLAVLKFEIGGTEKEICTDTVTI
jgi:hypothetical protein